MIPVSCVRDQLRPADEDKYLPEGTPVTMNIGFGVPGSLEVNISTRAEASRSDEARVHDLYVMIFDSDGDCFYNRYFTYEHLNLSLENLDSNSNEGWYVQNSDNSYGVVKIATQSKQNCKLVMLANVTNTITSLNHRDPVDVLSRIATYDELCGVRVTLEQEIVNRTDLFLMMADSSGVNTGDLRWGSFEESVATYTKPDGHYQLRLRAIDAKVKFWIKYNDTNLDPAKCEARKWQVFNVPSECYLMPSDRDTESDVSFFDTQRTYFEGTEIHEGDEYQVFSFYMLENRQSPQRKIMDEPSPQYYLREKETDPESEEATFIYAPRNGTFVKFDLLLALRPAGVLSILDELGEAFALTTEAMYTVHMGQFTNSATRSADWDDYDVDRCTSYNYYITINNSKSIYVEVLGENDGQGGHNDPVELQPGQEGSLLLSDNKVVNCDAHYAYHSLTFKYTPELEGKKVSWYVKTPFDEGGAKWIPSDDPGNPNGGDWEFNCKDYKWVQFGVNKITAGAFSDNRVSYPGNTYVEGWDARTALAEGQLMDIHQMYNYILHQTKLRNDWIEAKESYAAGEGADPGDYTGAFLLDPSLSTGIADDPATDYVDESHCYVIRVTAFIDEYYYEKDPRLDPETASADPDLWRQFVNKEPRELHILSESHQSADNQSDVITSSHSIIQQSIQTFYNTYSPDLRTLWGTEHVDEMEYRVRKEKDSEQAVWPWWPSDRDFPLTNPNSDDNGRYNTSRMWGVDATHHPYWEDFESHPGMLNYSVDNDHPELEPDYRYLAYSCLTRNRDNNGNHVIDIDEIRWYTASVNQLVGMWVGNESLSPSARLYQPENKNSTSIDTKEWRSWVISSTASSKLNPRVIRAEEGCTKSDHTAFSWQKPPQLVFSETDRDQVSSVRCVRNIGTFNSGGKVVDISYADLDVIPDKYYDAAAGFDANGKVKPNADGTYTLKFSRLDPRSIREFTSEDLPYHEEYSMHNRVYMELVMQDKDNYAYADGSLPGSQTEDEINDAVTSSGHNSYCPPGYRFPNMTELLLMTALQPSDYWSSSRYLCRTYFSRGVRGNRTTPGENHKIGWGFDGGKLHLYNSRVKEPSIISGIRCVRDNNCTGAITGSISVPGGDRLHLGDDCTIKLNISSLGSAIKSLNLYLVYVNSSGLEVTQPIDIGDIKLSGVSIQDEEVTWTVPDNLAILGNMSIRAVAVNNMNMRKVLEAPIRVISPVLAAVKLLPCRYDLTNEEKDNPAFPVMLTATSPSSRITSWRLRIKDPDREIVTVTPSVDSSDELHWNTIWNYEYSSLAKLIEGTYTFQLEVLTADGVRTSSNVASMDILRVNYHPNPRTDYAHADSISVKWEPDVVEGMSMAGGDFIEANMDVSNCTTYVPVMQINKPTKRDDNKSVFRDNLISIGITGTDNSTGITTPYVYHVYYPYHEGDESSNKNWARALVTGSPVRDKDVVNYKWFTGGPGTGFMLQSGSDYMPDPTKRQHFRLEKAGAFWNNQWLDPMRWADNDTDAANVAAAIDFITSSDTFYIGSTQGSHRSRARYCFVRAVRNSAASPAGGNTSFDDDPISGGDL